MNYEPSLLEIFLTKIAFILCGKSVYEEFANRLKISGKETVLDFGSGLGTVGFYVARKLTEGQLICYDISKRWMSICRKTLRKYKNVSFLQSEFPSFAADSFDIIFCHFVLHDISNNELEGIIPVLANSLKFNGSLTFCEPINETIKIFEIKRLIEKNGLSLKESRITDVPLMCNALECVYIKNIIKSN